MSYKLKHTASEIDYKLDLIDKNKNLLEYPYGKNISDWSLPSWLEDTGDGSLLITEPVELNTDVEILLNTCVLPVGKKYTVSIDYIDTLTDEVISDKLLQYDGYVSPIYLEVVPSTASGLPTVKTSCNLTAGAFMVELDLTEITETAENDGNGISAVIYLHISGNSFYQANLMIRPQTEEGTGRTGWVPYMNKIGTYVDERFNGTNAKIKTLAKNRVGESTSNLGERFNVYEDCTINGVNLTATKVVSTAAHAEGNGTLAGAKCFRFVDHAYSDADKNEDGTGWYYLTDVAGINEILLGSEEPDYTVVLKGNYDFLGVIKEVNSTNNSIKVSNYVLPGSTTNSTLSLDSSYLLLPKYPELGTYIIGQSAHAEGDESRALSLAAHAEGNCTLAAGKFSHAEGNNTIAGYSSHAEGRNTQATGETSHAEGMGSIATGLYSHAEGNRTKAYGNNSHTEGQNSTANGSASHAEGYKSSAVGNYSHAQNSNTIAAGESSHAEGYYTKANGSYSHVEGEQSTSDGQGSHAEGKSCKSIGNYSHAEGRGTTAGQKDETGKPISGECAHTEGYGAAALGNYTHAEGYNTKATGARAHAEGWNSLAAGDSSHAEGKYSQANGAFSHAEGNTQADSEYQHTQGKYNILDAEGKYAHIVGNGATSGARSNAHTLDWSGNAWFKGNVYIGDGSSQAKKSLKLATEDFVHSLIGEVLNTEV